MFVYGVAHSTEFGITEQASRGAVSVCDLRVMNPTSRQVAPPCAAWEATHFRVLLG